MSRRSTSLRWLIGGIYFSLTAVLLGGLALFFSYRVEADLEARTLTVLRGNARNGADWLSPSVETFTHPANAEARINAAKEIKRTLSRIYLSTYARRVALLTKDGKVVDLGERQAAELPYTATPSPSSRYDPEVRDAVFLRDLGEDIRENPAAAGERTFFVAVPVKIREAVPIPKDLFLPTTPTPRTRWVARHVLLIAVPLTGIQETVASMKVAIGLAFLAALLVLLVVNTLVSNSISRPLATLSAAAQRIADGQLDERVPPVGASEVASLGDSFNQMADQLRRFISTLASERAQAQAILTSMADAVLVTDTAGNILLLNQAAEALLGLHGPAVQGKTLSEALLPYELDTLLQQALTTQAPVRLDLAITRPSERFVEAHVAPVSAGEQPVGVVIVLYDMTNERRLAQIRRDFVANVSHELRTPVTSIRAMAETLLDGALDDPAVARDFLTTITGESERLTALLDDLLHLSRLESGRRPLARDPLDLVDIIHHVAQRLMTPITEKGQRLVLEMPDALPFTGDRNALIQILVNLLDNARKYSPEGAQITVRITSTPAQVAIHVADTGIGISREDRERIFERFYRVDKARSRAQGGTGLGLSIVKHLVEQHGGAIAVESEVGVGSQFTVRLPHVGDSPPEDAGERPSGSPRPDAGQISADGER
ncbi:MAG TPA: ATP-binding protein [Armatimonadota bacterium]|nr:ATP-binding protein [Armatimonadota bacterium]